MKEPIWIDKDEVLAIHQRMLMAHGGLPGMRDETLLESAIARPRQHLAYTAVGILEMAAIYTAGIAKNHPFVDGNKRAGFVTGALFLEMNGYEFVADQILAAQAVIELAAGTIDEKGFTLFLRDHTKRVRKKS